MTHKMIPVIAIFLPPLFGSFGTENNSYDGNRITEQRKAPCDQAADSQNKGCNGTAFLLRLLRRHIIRVSVIVIKIIIDI